MMSSTMAANSSFEMILFDSIKVEEEMEGDGHEDLAVRRAFHGNVRTEETELFQCLQCSRSFVTIKELNIHNMIHNMDTFGPRTSRAEEDPLWDGIPEVDFPVCDVKRPVRVYKPSPRAPRIPVIPVMPVDPTIFSQPPPNSTSNPDAAEGYKPLRVYKRKTPKQPPPQVPIIVPMKSEPNPGFIDLPIQPIKGETKPVVVVMKDKALRVYRRKPRSNPSDVDVTADTVVKEINSDKINSPAEIGMCIVKQESDLSRFLSEDGDSEGHAVQKNFHCFMCKESFYAKAELESHWVTHNLSNVITPEVVYGDEFYLSCHKCSEQFSKRVDLKLHLLVRHPKVHRPKKTAEEKWFHCHTCKEKYRTRRELSIHNKSHKRGRPTPFLCHICSKQFATRNTFRDHLNIHAGLKPYVCECGKRFVRFYYLKKHSVVHSGEKSFPCKYCPKKFNRPDNMRVHLRTHTGERPFGCIICGKAFTTNQVLQFHILSHTGEKPVSCSMCSKRFINKQSMKLHLRTHKRRLDIATGEKL